MTDRPILFSGPMVSAILDGIKTQTRRIITRSNAYRDGYLATKSQWDALNWSSKHIFDPGPSPAGNPGPYLHVPDKDGDCSHRIYPKWQPGDRLWARETWQYADWTEDGDPYIRYRADNKLCLISTGIDPEWSERLSSIWAELSAPENYRIDNRAADRRWRSARFMPRWASRLTLELTDVRVERLQDIGEADAICEGINRISHGREGTYYHAERTEPHPNNWCFPSDAFRELWDSINAKRAPWASNPWVWALTFRGLP